MVVAFQPGIHQERGVLGGKGEASFDTPFMIQSQRCFFYNDKSQNSESEKFLTFCQSKRNAFYAESIKKIVAAPWIYQLTSTAKPAIIGLDLLC